MVLNLDRPVAPVLDVRSEQYQQFSVNVYVLQSGVLSEPSWAPPCVYNEGTSSAQSDTPLSSTQSMMEPSWQTNLPQILVLCQNLFVLSIHCMVTRTEPVSKQHSAGGTTQTKRKHSLTPRHSQNRFTAPSCLKINNSQCWKNHSKASNTAEIRYCSTSSWYFVFLPSANISSAFPSSKTSTRPG